MRCTGLPRGAAIGVSADRKSAAVRPFDRIVFDNPVVATGERNTPKLRKRVDVADMLEGNSLDPNEAGAALRRDKCRLTRGGFNQVIGGRSRGQANVNGGSGVFNPEARIGRAANLLHNRAAPPARRQTVLRHGWNRKIGDGRQMRHRQFAKLFHRLQRFAVDKHQSAAPEKRPHVDGSGIEPYPTPHDAGQRKGLVGIGEHRAIEFVAPGGNGWLRRTALAPKTGETNWNGLLHPTVFQDFRAFDENLRPRSGLVTDHLRGTRTSARRAYALAVGARGDHHALAGLEHLGSLVDGAERPPLRARSVVVGLGMVIVYVVGLGEFRRLFPGGILGAVGQTRIRRNGVGVGLGRAVGGIVLSMAQHASTQSGHRAHARRILQKVTAIDGLAGSFIL